MQASYAKLRNGGWGVRIEGNRPERGEGVTVTKRDGRTKNETIGRVLWSGDGVHLCTIDRDEDDRPRGRRHNDDDGCPSCGEEEAWECGCSHPWHDSH